MSHRVLQEATKSSTDLPYPGIQCLRCGVERGLIASCHKNCWLKTKCRNIGALCISASAQGETQEGQSSHTGYGGRDEEEDLLFWTNFQAREVFAKILLLTYLYCLAVSNSRHAAIRSKTCSKCDPCSTAAVWWLLQAGWGRHPLRVVAGADELLELFSALGSKNYIGCWF